LRTNEKGKHLTLNEHDDDDDEASMENKRKFLYQNPVGNDWISEIIMGYNGACHQANATAIVSK